MRAWLPATMVTMVLALTLVARPAEANARAPQLWLYNVHTHQELQSSPYAYNGVLDWNAWAELNRFFRSWRTHEAHPMAPRLLELLVKIQATYGGRRMEIVSGFRSPGERDSLSMSNHFEGDAADIRIPGVSNRELFELCRSFADVGCGLYPNGAHVHVDVRAQSAIWVDLSGYGDGARYVASPESWLLRHPDAASTIAKTTVTTPSRHGRSAHRR
ncbi:MAG TPA: DUF882 domain-containing protein [Polyangia bacterium]|nr:DUF882 domain-containing protein [Polyangia bacterium]